MAADIGDLSPEIALLVGAVVVLVYALCAPRTWQRWAAALAVLTLVIAIIAALPLLGDAPRTIMASTYALDSATAWARIVICAIAGVCIALSVEWFATDARQGEYYALLLMSTLGAVLLAGALDLMEVVLGLLLSSATGYVLVAYHRRSRRAAEAGIKYYLLGALTNGAMLYGVALLYGLTGSTTYSAMRPALAAATPLALTVATVLIVIGLAFKIGAVPAHAWLPDVADGAPGPVAAFVTAAPKLGALVALARLAELLPEDAAGWRPLVALLAAATMTLGNVVALRQDDVRRLLGWSAVSQSGYAMMGVVALGRSELALPSLMVFLVAYVVGNLAAFGVVVELRGRSARGDYAGLATHHPALGLALLLSFLSFIGIPPLVGFAGKLALFTAVIDARYTWLAVLAAINTVVSVAYYIRVLAPAYLDTPSVVPAVLGRWAWAATVLCAAALVVLGLAAEALFHALAGMRLAT